MMSLGWNPSACADFRAQGRRVTMQQHGPSGLDGPVSLTRGWWTAVEQPGAGSHASQRPRADRPMRQDLIDRVRREIAEGTYDTPEKWDQALDRLLDDLEGRQAT
jgi:hypothetical protein